MFVLFYDHTGVFAVKHGNETYYYRKDAQANIVELLDSTGAGVVECKYDAWGKCQTTVVDSAANTIAELNPFRYRGYYFDTETGFYFLKTRYYDPEIGRFITIDDISYLTPEKINGLNLYAYCNDNPISNIDPSGNSVLGVLALLLLSGVIVHAATLVGSYAVAAVASIWDPVIRKDMNNIHWNPFNTDISATLRSEKVSFYKGSAVWRHSIPDASSCGIFGMIFLNRDEDEFNPDSHDALRHEWGHNMQELIIGTPAYLLFVALPSVIYCQFGDYINYPDPIDERMYYSKVWERTADWLGGVNRNNYDPFWTKENFMFW